jgi:hypothetical protein
MKMNEHVPGPWYYDEEKKLGITGLVYYGRGLPIAMAHTVEDPRGKHNARLIAAAPNLLEALEAMLEFPDSELSKNVARIAIRKARGE